MLILYSIQTFTIHLLQFVNTHSFVEPLLAFQLKSCADNANWNHLLVLTKSLPSCLSPLVSSCSPLHNVSQRKHSPSHTFTFTHTY